MHLEIKCAIFVFWIFLQVQGSKGKLFKRLFSFQFSFLNPGLEVRACNPRIGRREQEKTSLDNLVRPYFKRKSKMNDKLGGIYTRSAKPYIIIILFNFSIKNA